MNHIVERPLRLVGTIVYETRDATTGAIIPEESGTVRNIVTDQGLGELARILSKAALVNPGKSWEVAVGTSATAPTASDVGLNAEVYRGAATSVTASGTSLTIKLFLDTTNANGNTLAEVGAFHDLKNINHALLSPTIQKTNTKTVNISVTLSISR